MHDGSCLATLGRVVRYGICPHLDDRTKPVHVDVSVILQLLGKLHCQDLVKVGGEVAQGVAHCQLWFGKKQSPIIDKISGDINSDLCLVTCMSCINLLKFRWDSMHLIYADLLACKITLLSLPNLHTNQLLCECKVQVRYYKLHLHLHVLTFDLQVLTKCHSILVNTELIINHKWHPFPSTYR